MNVWMLLVDHRVMGDVRMVLGPFTNVVIDSGMLLDTLTGKVLASYNEPDETWRIWDGRGGYGSFDQIIFQSGGFESPWCLACERGDLDTHAQHIEKGKVTK